MLTVVLGWFSDFLRQYNTINLQNDIVMQANLVNVIVQKHNIFH